MSDITITDGTSDTILANVGIVAGHLAERTKRIDFTKGVLDENDINDLKAHLGYARTYADIVRLHVKIREMMYGQPETGS